MPQPMGPGARQSRREADNGSRLSRPAEAPAHRARRARRVSSATVILATAALPVVAQRGAVPRLKPKCQRTGRSRRSHWPARVRIYYFRLRFSTSTARIVSLRQRRQQSLDRDIRSLLFSFSPVATGKVECPLFFLLDGLAHAGPDVFNGMADLAPEFEISFPPDVVVGVLGRVSPEFRRFWFSYCTWGIGLGQPGLPGFALYPNFAASARSASALALSPLCQYERPRS